MKPYEGTEAYKAGYEQGLKDGQPKWIPVTERLPELPMCSAVEVVVEHDLFTYYTSDIVLVCLEDGTIKFGQYEYEETSDQGSWNVDGLPQDVTAWMPLPEPHEEKGKNYDD